MSQRTLIQRLAALGGLFFATALLASPALAGQKYAFLVGVRYVDSELTTLDYTEDDVTDLADVLTSAGGYDDRNVVLMTETLGARHKRFLPLARNIHEQLESLLAEVTEEDSVLVAFSGHGIQFQGDEFAYFCPVDTRLGDRESLVSLGRVGEALRQCKAKTKVLLVDACRSDPNSGASDRPRPPAHAQTNDKPTSDLTMPGISAFFSCQAGQRSYEAAALKHSVFLHFVIEGLSGKADLDSDQEVSMEELELYSARKIQGHVEDELGGSQTPERQGDARGLVDLASRAHHGDDAPLHAGDIIQNSVGMSLVFVTAPRSADAGFGRAFSLGRFEVTVGQFRRFVEETGYRTDAEADGGEGFDPHTGEFLAGEPRFTWRNPGFRQADDQPVVNVSYNDALAFCQWLSAREGREYRLPTEAEWQHACLAGAGTRFASGDSVERLAAVANLADLSLTTRAPALTGLADLGAWDDAFAFTAPVGRFKANAFGLFDLHGNVAEWCLADDSAVLRGGSFRDGWTATQATARELVDPSHASVSVGFRLLRVEE